MKPRFRSCVATPLAAVVLATLILTAIPDTAEANWPNVNRADLGLKIHNRYWGTVPNDIRIVATGRMYDGGRFRPGIAGMESNCFPAGWHYRAGYWVVAKFGHSPIFPCRWCWVHIVFTYPRGASRIYYRWDWTRNCSYYRRGGGNQPRWYLEPPPETSDPAIVMPNWYNLPVIQDSTSTQDPDTLLASFVRVDSVQWANSPAPIPLEQLTLTGTSGLSWTAPDVMYIISQGDSVSFPQGGALDPPEEGGRTVLMKGKFQTSFDDPDSLGHWTNFVMQFRDEKEVPAASTWGIVFLVMGALAVALILVLKRKHTPMRA